MRKFRTNSCGHHTKPERGFRLPGPSGRIQHVLLRDAARRSGLDRRPSLTIAWTIFWFGTRGSLVQIHDDHEAVKAHYPEARIGPRRVKGILAEWQPEGSPIALVISPFVRLEDPARKFS